MTVAVITGAAGGIGAGLARQAARRGMHVVLADRDATALAAITDELGDRATAVPTDVADLGSVQALAERAFAVCGHVDLLFNNAGVLSTGLSWEIEPSRWRQSLDVNVMGVIHGIRAFVPRMLVSDGRSRIINTSSVGGFLPAPLMGPYGASKFAVVAITECLAGELAMQGDKVTASLLAPGPVRSDIFREVPPKGSADFHNVMTRMMAENAMDGDSFASLVLDAVDAGEYWIVPQPEALDPGLEARSRTIAERRRPSFHLGG